MGLKTDIQIYILRTPQPTSLMRAIGFNKPQLDHFLNMLTELTEKHNFPASTLYNADETGVSFTKTTMY